MYLHDWNSTASQSLRTRGLPEIPVSFSDILQPAFSNVWSNCPFPLLPGKEMGLVNSHSPSTISGKQMCDPTSGCCLMCGAASLIVQRPHVATSLAESPIPSLVRVLHTSYFFSAISIFGVAFLFLSILCLPTHFTRGNSFVLAYAFAGVIVATAQLINVQDYPKNVCYNLVTKGSSENLKSCSVNSTILEFCYIWAIVLSFNMSLILHLNIVWGKRTRAWMAPVSFILGAVLASALVGIIASQGVQFFSGVTCQPEWPIAIGVGHGPLLPLSIAALILQFSSILYAAKVLLKYRKHRRISKDPQNGSSLSFYFESAMYQWRPLAITVYVTIVDNLNCSLITSSDAHRATPASLSAWVQCFVKTGDADACRRDSHVKLAPFPWWATYVPMFLMLLNGAIASAISFRVSMLRGWYLISRHPLSFWKTDEWTGNRPISSVFSVVSRRESRISRPISQNILGNKVDISGSTQVGSQLETQLEPPMKITKCLNLSSSVLSNATTAHQQVPQSDRHLSFSTQTSTGILLAPQAIIPESVFEDDDSIPSRRGTVGTFGQSLDNFYHNDEDDVILPIQHPNGDVEASAQQVKIKNVRVEVKQIRPSDSEKTLH